MALFSHLMKDVLSTLLPFAHFLEVAFFGCIRKQDGSYFDSKTRRVKTACTLESGINVGVRLLFFEKNGRKKNMKNDGNALIDVKMN